MKENVILDKTLDFSLGVIRFSEQLEVMRKYVIARQILRSGTSIGANVREAQNCESLADFVHKLKVAAKEVEETEYWFLLCERAESYPYDKKLMDDLKEIQKIINSILKTTILKLTNTGT